MAWTQVGNIRGPQGVPGVGVTYRGNLADATELATNTGTPQAGDMWITLDDGHAHIRNAANNAWQDVGPWLGPAGADSTVPGPRGSLWHSGTATVIELNTTGTDIPGSALRDHYLHLGNGDVYEFQ